MGRSFISISLLSVGLFSWSADGAGFINGDRFTATPMTGKLTLVCDNGKEHIEKLVNCARHHIEPVYFDNFESHDHSSQADWVVLRQKLANGQKIETGRGFDSQTGYSTYAFNLWDRQQFKNALLELGKNEIKFELRDRNSQQVFESGEFIVYVDEGQKRQCQDGYYETEFMGDCEKLERACREYFAREHYCQ